jgi:hypothetical protein
VLSESQLAALEKATAGKEAHGDFESECWLLGRTRYFLRGHAGGRRPPSISRLFRRPKVSPACLPVALVMGMGVAWTLPRIGTTFRPAQLWLARA